MIRRIILSFILSILVLTASAQVYFKTVTVIQPGTLKTLLGERLDTITALKVNGSINGTDFVTLRLLAGYDKYHIPDLVEGSLRLLDLSDACIVEGGGREL